MKTNTKKIMAFLAMFMIVIFVTFLILYINDDVGISKGNIENDARASQKIDDNWQVAKSTTDTMSAMLFYDGNSGDDTYSVYVNRPGLSFGYFFRGGGSTTTVNEGVAGYRIEGYNECAYLSMNNQKIDRIEITSGNLIKTIDIESTKPFAVVLPIGEGSITIYDADDNIVEPTMQTL